MRSLCSGATRAKTFTRPRSRSSSSPERAVSVWPSSAPSPSGSSPSCRPMARAVPTWSPVSMSTRMPAWCVAWIASTASGRTGSSMPCRPANTSPSVRRRWSRCSESVRRKAIASTRIPSPAIVAAGSPSVTTTSVAEGRSPASTREPVSPHPRSSTCPFGANDRRGHSNHSHDRAERRLIKVPQLDERTVKPRWRTTGSRSSGLTSKIAATKTSSVMTCLGLGHGDQQTQGYIEDGGEEVRERFQIAARQTTGGNLEIASPAK
jgi:hypothetical protein